MRTASALAVALLLWAGAARAQAGPPRSPVGEWLTEDRGGVVQIRPCGEALCGTIIGLTFDPGQTIKLDVHGRSQCHLELLGNLRLQGDRRWHGTVTNPEDGRTYSAEVWVGPDGVMRLLGYFGLEIFGVTQHWPPFAGTVKPDCRFH